MPQPTYRDEADGNGKVRTYSVLEGLICAPNGVEAWRTLANGSISGATLVSAVLTSPTITSPVIAGMTLTGHLLFTDNTYDIGASAATRPRTGYFGTSLVSPILFGTTNLDLYGANGDVRIYEKTHAVIIWNFDGVTGDLTPAGADNSYNIGSDTKRVKVVEAGTFFYTMRKALATTSTDGLILENATAATSGTTVQISPRARFRGTAWDTAASATVDFFLENLPAAAATPTGTLKFGYSLNGAAATYPMTLTSAGTLSAVGYQVSGNAFATATVAPASPTGTTSTTLVMAGLAGSITTRTGKIVLTMSGYLTDNTANDGTKCQMSYGTGTAPINGAALTGTQVGPVVQYNASTLAAGASAPYAATWIVTGLSAGTAYWFDTAFAAITGGTGALVQASMTAYDIP